MPKRARRACLVAHSVLPMDPRVLREATALLDAGWTLDVICLRGQGEPPPTDLKRARIFGLPVRRHRGSGLAVYLLEYVLFFLLAGALLSWLSLRRHYRLVQVHNVPDFLVFTALLPRALGARV